MKLCLGTVQFGMDYGVQGQSRPSQKTVDEILTCAIEQGISCLDTASAYGDAEHVIGCFFKNIIEKKNLVRIVSKLPPNALDDTLSRAWTDTVLKYAEKSLKTLGIDRLDAYLFHNAGYLFREKSVKALRSVVNNGFTEKIGVSIYSPVEAMKALEYDEIKVVQIPYNVFDQRLEQCGFFEKAKKKGIEIYARSTLLQGLITMDPDNLPDNMSFASDYLKRFLSICYAYSVSPLKAAVGYVSASPYIDYMVFGVDNKIQLEQYISMGKESISKEMICELRAAFAEVEEKLVNPVLWN